MKRHLVGPLDQLTVSLILCLLAIFGISAKAANYTWDTAAGDSAITDGGGTWTAGAGNWFNGTSYDQNWANGNVAIFGGGTAGTAGTVTLGGAVAATGLIFNAPFAGTYTLNTATFGLTLNSPASITNNVSATIQNGTGGSLALGAAATVGVVAGKTLTISSPISGSTTMSLTKTGNGTLELDGANTFGNNANGLTISGGAITIGGAGALLGNAGSGCVVTNNGSIVFNSSANSLVFGVCAGTGTWEQRGPGMFTFGGGATYTFTGNVILTGGILRAAINSAAAATRTNNLGAGASQLFLNGGELRCATGNNIANNTNVNYNRNTTVGGSGVTITSDRGTNAAAQGNAVTYSFGTLSISNQTLTVQAGASGLIGGTAGITFGDVTLTGAPTFLVNSNVANVGTLLTLGAILDDVNLVTFDGTGNSQVNGIIGGGAGTGGLTKNGTGTLTLAGANTYTGNTTISAGTLVLSGSGSLASSTITANGTFDVSALSFTLNNNQALAGTGTVVGNVSLAAGALIRPGGAASAGTLTFSSNLAFDPAATVVLDCSSSAVSGNDKVVLTNSSAVLNGGGATITINQLGGANTLASADYLLFDLSGASGSVAGDFNSTPAWSPSAPANAANYSIVTVGKQVLLKYTAPSGSPVLTIETSPTGSGSVVASQNVPSGTSVTGYAILRTSGGAFIANTNVTWSLVNATGGVVSSNLTIAIDNKSATFTAGRVGSGQMQIASPGLTSANSGTLTVVAGTATQLGVETQPDGSGVAVAAQTVALGGTVTGYAIRRDSGGNFVDNVSVTWSLANKYGDVVDGDLAAAGTSATFTANLAGSATMHAVSGALAGDSGLLTVYQDLRWTGVGAVWDVNTPANWVVLPSASANAAFVNNLSSVLFDDNGAANPTVTLTGSLSPTSVTVSGTTSYQLGGTGKITGAAALTNNNTGTLTLVTSNDYSGGTVSTAGRIRLGADNVLGSGLLTLSGGALSSDSSTGRRLTNAISIAANTTFGDSTDTGTLTNTGPVTTSGAGKTLTFNSDAVFTGGFTNGAGNASVKAGPGTLTLQGAVNLNTSANWTFDTTLGTLTLDGAAVAIRGRFSLNAAAGTVARLVITNGATVSQTDTGANERVNVPSSGTGSNYYYLAGTYSLPSASSANGRLIFNNTAALSEFNLLAGGNTTVYAVTNDGTSTGLTRFNFNGGTLRAKGNSTNFFPAGTITEANVQVGGANIDTDTNSITIGQSLLAGSLSGGLTKLGAGTLTLTGNNTYSGLTTVSNGALWVEGSLAGAATVCAGATLSGNGTIQGAVTNQTNATLSPGDNAIGTLAISTLSLNAGSVTLMEVNQTSGTSDKVTGLSAVAYGGTLVVTNLAGTVTNGSQFTLFNAAGSSGNFSSISGSPGANLVWSFNPATGVLSAVSGVSPTNTLAVSVSGSTMTLTWPNPGWYAQSNSVDLANTNYWFDIPNSQLATNQIITISPSSANVFYRLRKP